MPVSVAKTNASCMVSCCVRIMGDDTLPHRWLLGLHHDIGNGMAPNFRCTLLIEEAIYHPNVAG